MRVRRLGGRLWPRSSGYAIEHIFGRFTRPQVRTAAPTRPVCAAYFTFRLRNCLIYGCLIWFLA
ncbi:hypothetical protein MOTT27_04720 [Mycobacterium intracellulare subsp. yongonense]|nr:hypothetical protein MOTT27_04720 [Mycobacterium intracellulare subsp. yongonense]